eukprot:g70727.t1
MCIGAVKCSILQSFGKTGSTPLQLCTDVSVGGKCVISSTTNPLLGSLANNGGPTQTMALLPASQAIDAANCQPTLEDQRGEPIQAHPDIGAFEYQPPSESPSTSASPSSSISESPSTSVLPSSSISESPSTSVSPSSSISESPSTSVSPSRSSTFSTSPSSSVEGTVRKGKKKTIATKAGSKIANKHDGAGKGKKTSGKIAPQAGKGKSALESTEERGNKQAKASQHVESGATANDRNLFNAALFLIISFAIFLGCVGVVKVCQQRKSSPLLPFSPWRFFDKITLLIA